MRFSFILFFLVLIFFITACSSTNLDTPLITAKEREAFETSNTLPRNFAMDIQDSRSQMQLIYQDGALKQGYFNQPIGELGAFPPRFEHCYYDSSWNLWAINNPNSVKEPNDKPTLCSINPSSATVNELQEYLHENAFSLCGPSVSDHCYTVELPPAPIELPKNFVITIQNSSDEIKITYKDGKSIESQHEYTKAPLTNEEQKFTSLIQLEKLINSYDIIPCNTYLHELHNYERLCYYIIEVQPSALPETFTMQIITDDSSSAALRTFNATLHFKQNELTAGTASYSVDVSGDPYSTYCLYNLPTQRWVNASNGACDILRELEPTTKEHLQSLMDSARLKSDDGSCHWVYCYTLE